MTNYAYGPTSKSGTGDEKRLDAVLEAFANPIRRRLVAILFESPNSSVGLSELAERLEAEDDPPQIESLESLRIDLHHRHLPILSDAGLMAYETESRRATATVDPATLDADIQDVFTFPEKNAEETDAAFEAVADPRRRYILETLTETSHAVTVEAIAIDLSQQLQDGCNQPTTTGDWKRVQELITHTDLPLLAEAELIHYDPEANRVRSRTPEGRDNETATIVELSTSC